MEMSLSGNMRGGKQTIGGAQLGPTETHNSSLTVGSLGTAKDAVESTSSSDLVSRNVRGGKQTIVEAQLGHTEAHNSSLTVGTAVGRHNDAVESTFSSDLVSGNMSKQMIGGAQPGPIEAHNSSLTVGTAVGRYNDAVASTSSSDPVSGNVKGGKQTIGGVQLGPTEAHNSSLTAGTAVGRHNDAIEPTSSSDVVVARLFSHQLRVNAKSFKDLLPMLIVLLPMTSKESPFKTNATEMWVLVVATIIFCLAYRTSNAVVAVISGSLSIASLLSIFLSDSIGFLVFIPWSLVPLVVAYQRIRLIFNYIHDACLTLRLDRQMIMDFIISKFSVIWIWLTRSDSSEQEQEQEQATTTSVTLVID